MVELDKGGEEVLAIQCVPSMEAPEGTPEDAHDGFEIQDVALLKASQEWTDDTYSLSSMIMDGVWACFCFFPYLKPSGVFI